MNEGRLPTAADVQRFVLAGSAYLTLRSLKTGVRFTYRVKRAPQPKDRASPTFFVAMLTGPDNETDYAYIGFLRNGVYTDGKQMSPAQGAPGAKAWAWAWRQVRRGELPPELEVYHAGRCGRCGRKLTTPESVAIGLGPLCLNRGG